LTLIAVSLIAWFAVAWGYHLNPVAAQNSILLLRAGAVNGELLRAGEWWRIFASQFLHVYFLHLIFNMASLFLLGRELERELGSLRFAAVYVISGSASQLISVMAAPALVTSGASQAVMGIAGATVSSFLRRRESGKFQLVVLLTVIGITAALDLAAAGRIKPGHFGGLCAGAVLGWIISLDERRD
jgi:membrane associated rhomboid family serine protease